MRFWETIQCQNGDHHPDTTLSPLAYFHFAISTLWSISHFKFIRKSRKAGNFIRIVNNSQNLPLWWEEKSDQNSVPQLVLCQNCNLAMLSKNHVCTVDYDDDDDNEDDEDHAKCTEHECVFEHGDIRRRDCTVAS